MTAVLAVAFAVSATAAQAHVTVKPESTVAGGFSQLVFRVPTESDTASTVKLEVKLPTDKPLLYVSTLPVAGWTAKVTEASLAKPVESYGTTLTKAPSTITWTANSKADGIKPGQYQNFAISAGPIPEGALTFPATQIYSDGETVHWVELQKAGAEEPEHPAPTFTAVTAADATTATTPLAATTGSSNDSSTVGVIALVVGALGLIAGLTALLRGRKRA